VREEKAEGTKIVGSDGPDHGACKELLLTFGELEAPDRADGVEQVVMPLRQRQLRAQDERVLM